MRLRQIIEKMISSHPRVRHLSTTEKRADFFLLVVAKTPIYTPKTPPITRVKNTEASKCKNVK